MRVLVITAMLAALAGCQSTPPSAPNASVPAAEFNGPVKQIALEELSSYWVIEDAKPKMLSKRPDWLPKGAGQWRVKTVIDSNGNEVEKTLIDSQPEGFMTQEMVDAMPRQSFKPAESNPERKPVSFIGTAVIGKRI